ncbi:MAG: pectate lyase [Paludibacteraceae bacterium]|nr:pectate lyase [Paludibacteraceae bacterium]
MKKVLFVILLVLAGCGGLTAGLNDLTWYQVCTGGMSGEWYSSPEALDIADIVIAVQKTNGGWMKNDQLHKLSSSEYQRLLNEKGAHSCLDNVATTQEMRYLARVWKATGNDACRQAFLRGLQMIHAAQKGCGGWSQYWPLSNDNGYQDYVTFNDDLTVNVLKMLRDIYNNTGDFANITDAATREACKAAFNRGVQCILDCQIIIDGTYAAWCAQHDTVAPYLPTEGRPHELPSVSGCESANLLSFLMSLDDPSDELKARITAAVAWLDEHKIADHAVEDFTNENQQKDRRIIEQKGTHLWGRFIQIGGNTGEQVYNKLFDKLKKRNKKRSYTYNGTTCTYTEEELARANYDPTKAYEPIYAIYKDSIQHMYYRFLYNFEDTPIAFDDNGGPYYTSLFRAVRMGYQYVGSWCQRVIETEYPAWKVKHGVHDDGTYILSTESCVSNRNEQTYTFDNAFTITNDGGVGYSTAKSNSIRYNAGVNYTIHIPSDLQVTEAKLYGYCNWDDSDAYVQMWNNTTYTAEDYFFPRTKNDKAQWVTHIIDHAAHPVTDELAFQLAGKQACIIITLTCAKRGTAVENTQSDNQSLADKILRNGQLLIVRGDKTYDALGRQITDR